MIYLSNDPLSGSFVVGRDFAIRRSLPLSVGPDL